MSDDELNNLVKDVGFDTPKRDNDEDYIPEEDSIEFSDDDEYQMRKSEPKRVLVSDKSISRQSNLEYEESKQIIDSITAIVGSNPSDDESYERKEGTSILDKDMKKYKVICVDNPKVLCGRVMSQGVTFCINRNCTTNHKTQDSIEIKDKQMYVIKFSDKNRSVAFVEPSISTENIDENVVEQWVTIRQTLKSWTRLFYAVKQGFKEKSYLTQKDLMAEKRATKIARDFKTPKKEKVEKMFDKTMIMDYQAFEADESSNPAQNFAMFLQHTDQAFRFLFNQVEILQKNQEKMQQYVNDTSHNFDLRLAELADDIGTKPFHLDAKYDAPNLWGTIAQIADDMGNEFQDTSKQFVDRQTLKVY